MWFLAILAFLIFINLLDITTLPLMSLLFLSLFLREKKAPLFALAFFSGVTLDLTLLRPFGLTSLVFVIFTFLVLSYGRKFEIQSAPFIFFATFIGEFLYLSFFGYSNVIGQVLFSALASVVLFLIMRKFQLA